MPDFNKDNTNSTLIDNKVESRVIVEALLNDPTLKELYNELSKLHQLETPIVVIVSDNEFKACYSDEVNDAISKVHEMIKFRQRQIFSFYNLVDPD